MEERISMHPHKPHAASKPSPFSHTHRLSTDSPQTSTATNSAPYTRPIMPSALELQSYLGTCHSCVSGMPLRRRGHKHVHTAR